MRITEIVPTNRFARDYKGLDANRKAAVDQVLRDLLRDPQPASLRLHALKGHRPKIYAVDVDSNHSWQLFFELEGRCATILGVSRHPK